MKFNRTIIALIILFVAVGCDKDEEMPSGVYLTRVIYHQNADQVRHYFYDKEGLLSHRQYRFEDIIAERFDYKYQDGKISQIDFYSLNNQNDRTLHYQNHLLFEYEAGNIVKSTLVPDESPLTYQWNNDKRVTSMDEPTKTTEFLYDSRGNIKESTVYMDGEMYWKFFYEYDTGRNPFYNIDPIHDNFTRLDLIHYKCPNNLTKSIFINERKDTISINDFYYEYNDKNLPIESDELFTSESNGYYRDTISHILYEYKVK